MELEVGIDRLGAQGDGVAQGPDGPLYVPFTLPGELVRVAADEARTELLAILEASPDRRAPVCPHFGACGGCALQHMEALPYLAWKRGQVAAALKARGIEAKVEPMRPVPLASRRRARFAVRQGAQGIVFGFRAARSHNVVDLDACPLLTPRIASALPKLKPMLAPLLHGRREMQVMVTDADNGLDVVIEGGRVLPQQVRAFAAGAQALDIVRLTIDGDTAVLLAEPFVALSGARVALPPGSFLQASREAEAALVSLVREGTEGAKRIADLFAGLGTFAFALAQHAEVDAYEEDEAAIAAIAKAARTTPKLKPLRALVRDLFRNPLGPKELGRYDAVVLDPPRAGAKAQAESLAKSKVKTVVMVSCNPGTCARDVRILVDGGYSIISVAPVDQFLFSPHIELVVTLER
jgi:23S rRNA (uracil1939-C5)-methyltransferase